MAGDKIRKEDIIEAGLFDELVKGADAFIEKTKEIIKVNKQSLELSKEIILNSKVNNSESLSKQASEANKVTQNLRTLEQAEIDLIKVEKAKEQLLREQIRTRNLLTKEEQKALKQAEHANSLYAKQSKTLNDLRKSYKDLVLAEQQNTKEGQKMLVQIQKLDTALKRADASVGQFQRNVGNYPRVLDSITGKVAAAFSIGSVINFGQKILETRAEFQKFEAVLTNTLGSNSQAQAALTRIQDLAAKTPFSVQELTASFVKLANQGFKPTNEELTKLGDLAASQGKDFDQLTEALLDAQNGQFKRLLEFGIRAEKANDKVTLSFKGQKIVVDDNNESIRNAVIGLGNLEGVSGGMAAIAGTLGGKISNLGDAFDIFFNNLGQNSEGVFSVFLSTFSDFLNKANEAQTALNKINRELKEAGSSQAFSDKLFGGNSVLNTVNQQLEKVAASTAANTEKLLEYKTALVFLNTKAELGQITQEEYKNSLILVGAAIKATNEEIAAGKDVKTTDVGLTKEQIKAAKDLEKAQKDLNNQLIKLRIENTGLDQRKEEDNARNEFRLSKEQLDNTVANEETKLRILVQLEIELQNKLNAIQDKFALERKAKEQKELDEKIAKEKEIDDEVLRTAEITRTAQNQISQQITEDADKELKRRADLREKEYQDALKLSQQVLDIAAKEIAEKSELRQAGFDKDISDREKNIDRQRQLAEKGLANSLAFEERKKAEAELKKEDEKKKEIKRQKAIAFFKAFSVELESTKNVGVALSKAAGGMLLADLIAGAFFKGTEKVSDDLTGNPNVRDGYVVRVDGSERVMTGKQNEKVGNMSNEDLADLAHKYQNGLLEQQMIKVATLPSDNFAKNIGDSAMLNQLVSVNNRLQSLEKTIKDKAENQIHMDNMGNIINTTIEAGIKTTILHKRTKKRF